jgi:hypothetical protein
LLARAISLDTLFQVFTGWYCSFTLLLRVRAAFYKRHDPCSTFAIMKKPGANAAKSLSFGITGSAVAAPEKRKPDG